MAHLGTTTNNLISLSLSSKSVPGVWVHAGMQHARPRNTSNWHSPRAKHYFRGRTPLFEPSTVARTHDGPSEHFSSELRPSARLLE